ncbi:MAG: transcriptional repressor [Acholeplasmataceae bacterium]|nr:transcriptional repressor [Acholeplasmataceae bacterium]
MAVEDIIKSQFKINHIRATTQRIKIAKVLYKKILTLKDLHSRLSDEGYPNLATVYNNIEYLLERDVIQKIVLKGERYYAFDPDRTSHDDIPSVFLTCSQDTIVEVTDQDVIDYISHTPLFEKMDIRKLTVIVDVGCSHEHDRDCTKHHHCYLMDFKHRLSNT